MTSLKTSCRSMVRRSIAMAALVLCASFIASPSMAAESKLKQVKFYEIEKKEVLMQAYPFLKTALSDVISTEKQAGTDTTVFASKLSYPDLKKTMLVVRYDGSLYCGTSGCQTNVYLDDGDGKGYYEALDISSNIPIYVSSCNNNLSLFFGTDKGAVEWPLKGKAFDIGKTFPDFKSLPTCE